MKIEVVARWGMLLSQRGGNAETITLVDWCSVFFVHGFVILVVGIPW